MLKKHESKHDRFIRLWKRRAYRAQEELRLLSQLASPNYEHTPEEGAKLAETAIIAAMKVAQAFGVECFARLSDSSVLATNTSPNPVIFPHVRRLQGEDACELFQDWIDEHRVKLLKGDTDPPEQDA